MNSSNRKRYDLVILGAGSGGLTAAKLAAGYGLRVALLEKDEVGGDCLHTGCVPSKTLIHIARRVHDMAQPSKYIPPSKTGANFQAVMAELRLAQEKIKIGGENDEALHAEGIDVIHGHFRFNGDHELKSETAEVYFRKCIIASGSQPIIPPINGINDIYALTSDNIWQLEELPKQLAVIGGGPIGLELGQAFAMLGSQVTVFERGGRLVPRFDERVSQALKKGLEQSGVRIVFESEVKTVRPTGNQVTVDYTAGKDDRNLMADNVLVAIGRRPRTADLGLKEAGIAVNDKGGIIVDKYLRTNQKHIYAVGDCLAGPLFTHWSAEQATAATLHCLFGIKKIVDSNRLPTATFTTPEIGQLGATEQQLKGMNTTYNKISLNFGRIDKAVAESSDGFMEVLLDRRHSILGTVVVGPNAAELIGYFAAAMQMNMPFTSFSQTLQAYPTYTIAIKQLAGELKLQDFKRSLFSKLLLRLHGF